MNRMNQPLGMAVLHKTARQLAFLGVLLPLAAAAATGTALADCKVVGTVVATEMDDDSTETSFNRILVRQTALNNNSFSFTTADQEIMLAALIAKSSQMEVTVVGDAAACPKNGRQRKGGQLLQLDLNS